MMPPPITITDPDILHSADRVAPSITYCLTALRGLPSAVGADARLQIAARRQAGASLAAAVGLRALLPYGAVAHRRGWRDAPA